MWSGSEAGPQIGIGELDGEGHHRRSQRPRRSAVCGANTVGYDGVYIFAGNPKPQANWMEFDNGFFTVDGTIRARALEIIGQAMVGDDTSEIIIRDPADPRRYGHIKPHYLAGYSVDSTRHAVPVDAYCLGASDCLKRSRAVACLAHWVAGESFFGDWRYGHFRIERNGRVGLFNGETPKAYLDSCRQSVHATGKLRTLSGMYRWVDD